MKSNFTLYDDIGEDPIEQLNDFDCEDQGLEHEFLQQDGFEVCMTCGETRDDDYYGDEDMYSFKTAISSILSDYEPKSYKQIVWDNVSIPKIPEMSNVTLYIRKKAFNKLRKIALDAYLYKGTETSAILFGKENVVYKVKKFKAIHESAGLVSSDEEGLVKALGKKNFIGFFHSHVYESAHPSNTDKDCLSGWKAYKDPIRVFSLIGCPPHFKQRAWSMNDKFEFVEHHMVVL